MRLEPKGDDAKKKSSELDVKLAENCRDTKKKFQKDPSVSLPNDDIFVMERKNRLSPSGMVSSDPHRIFIHGGAPCGLC